MKNVPSVENCRIFAFQVIKNGKVESIIASRSLRRSRKVAEMKFSSMCSLSDVHEDEVELRQVGDDGVETWLVKRWGTVERR